MHILLNQQKKICNGNILSQKINGTNEYIHCHVHKKLNNGKWNVASHLRHVRTLDTN